MSSKRNFNSLYEPKLFAAWKRKSLFGLASWKNGLAFRKINFSQTGKPVIKIAELKNGLTDQTRYTNDQFDESYFLTKGDMLFSWSGNPETSIDVFRYNLPDGWLNQHIFKVTANEEEVSKDYLFYILKFLKPNFTAIASNKQTTGLGHVTLSDLEKIIIGVPELKEQKAIAHILSTLDEKIELNNKINKTLEDIAQAIFKHWFVDFEFPNEDGKPYKSGGGEMVESELGMIPKGWKVLEMGSIINVKDGTHDSPKPVVDGYPLITSKHLMVNKIDFKSANKISETDYNEVNKRSKVHRYDILISMIGTVGNLYLVQNEEIKFAIKNIGLFKTSERLDLYEYIYCYLNTPQIKHYITGRMAGSTQEYISLGELRKIPVLIPKGRLVNYFKKIVNPIFNKIYILSTEIEKLTDIRDTLLPKLMSGEIRVPLDQEGDCEEVS